MALAAAAAWAACACADWAEGPWLAAAAAAAAEAKAPADARSGGAAAAPADARSGGGPRAAPGAGGGGDAAHWVFMSGVGAGDSFLYRICDLLYRAAPAALPLAASSAAAAAAPSAASSAAAAAPPPQPHAAHPARAGHAHAGHGGGACYSVALHVEAVVGGAWAGTGGPERVQKSALYIVRAEAGAASAAPGLLVVDSERFSVLHVFAGDRPLAESLQRTVFWRDGWGGRVPLAYGEPVVELLEGVPSSALLVSGSRVQAGGARVEYVASHGVRIAAVGGGGDGGGDGGVSTLVVADGIGLPVSARIYPGARPSLDHYAARPVFEFELEGFEARKAESSGHPRTEAGADSWTRGPPIHNPHYAVHGTGAAAR